MNGLPTGTASVAPKRLVRRTNPTMPFNFFAVARRLAAAIALLCGAGWVVLTAIDEPEVSAVVRIEGPGAAPVPVDDCDEADVREFVRAADELSVTLCFRTLQGTTHKREIAYAVDDKGEPSVAELDSKEAYQYTKRVAAEFVEKLDPEAMARQYRSAALLAHWARSMTMMALGLLGGWGLVYGIGRAVRRYLRIPKGSDVVPELESAEWEGPAGGHAGGGDAPAGRPD